MSESIKSSAEQSYFINERDEMLDFVPRNAKRVIEFGCGEAIFSQKVKKRNSAEVWGVEFMPDAATIAENKLDKVIIEDLNAAAAKLPLSHFDCMIFNDVLEHLPDPWATLRSLKPALTPHGTIVASIPNVRYIGNLRELLIDEDWKYKKEGGILDFTHLRFFTKKSIITMFEECGYEVARIEGINATSNKLFPLINILTLGKFSDAKFLQFAVVASLKS